MNIHVLGRKIGASSDGCFHELTKIADEHLMTETDNQNNAESNEKDTSKSLWDKARLEDKERAWAKFEILQSFIQYRTELKRKGIKHSESGKSFVIKMKRGEMCREQLRKLNVQHIELPTLRTWLTVLKASGDIEHPYSLLENYRYCGRKSKIDAFFRNRIKEIAADIRNYNPSFIYNLLADELSWSNQTMPISTRTLQVMVRTFRKEVMTSALGKGNKAFKDLVKLHNVRINDLLPGELWESDAHVFNVLVKSPFYAHHNHARRYLV